MNDLNEIKRQINCHKIISFDIFDTLILRPFMRPTDLFLFMEKQSGAKGAGFKNARIRAEKSARFHNGCKEVTLDEIYQRIPDQFKSFRDREIFYEKQLNYVNPIAYELFRYAQELNKTIIIISDMYHSSVSLREMLAKNGIKNYQKLYVSSEHRMTKLSGRLFKFVIKENNYSPKDILHIGDSYYSDIFMAHMAGTDALLLPSPKKMMLQNNQKFRVLYRWNKHSLSISIYLAIIAKFLIVSNKNNYWYNFGFINGGPTMLSFMVWLSSQIKKSRIKDIAFVARDGYTLQRIFDLVTGHQYESKYLYAPRKINVLTSLDYESTNFFNNKRHKLSALSAIFDYFKNELPFDQECRLNYSRAHEFFLANQQRYEEMAAKKRTDYLSYLNEKLAGTEVAIVDTATTNFSAQQLFEKVDKTRSYKGFYFQVFSSKKKKSNHNHISFHRHVFHFFYSWETMELLMSAPEPPIIDVVNGKPVFKAPSAQETKRIEIYPLISDGALKFVETYQQIFGQSWIDTSCEELVEWMNHFAAYPECDDIKNFRDIAASTDFEHQKYVSMFGNWKFRKYLYRLLNVIMFAKVRNKLFRINSRL